MFLFIIIVFALCALAVKVAFWWLVGNAIDNTVDRVSRRDKDETDYRRNDHAI